jgi:hypothetical protein
MMENNIPVLTGTGGDLHPSRVGGDDREVTGVLPFHPRRISTR